MRLIFTHGNTPWSLPHLRSNISWDALDLATAKRTNGKSAIANLIILCILLFDKIRLQLTDEQIQSENECSSW